MKKLFEVELEFTGTMKVYVMAEDLEAAKEYAESNIDTESAEVRLYVEAFGGRDCHDEYGLVADNYYIYNEDPQTAAGDYPLLDGELPGAEIYAWEKLHPDQPSSFSGRDRAMTDEEFDAYIQGL